MGGESRAAHTGDAGILDDLDDLGSSQRIHIVPMLDGGVGSVLEVIFDDHRHHAPAVAEGPGLNGSDLARDTGVDGGAQTGGLTDELSHFHLIPYGHHRLTGGTDVHGHRDHHLLGRLGQRNRGLVLGQVFVFSGMDPAEELIQHSLTSIFPFSFPKNIVLQTPIS